MSLLGSIWAAGLLLTGGGDMALLRRSRPPTYSCDAAPEDRWVHADAQVNENGTVVWASVDWSVGLDFHGPVLSGRRQLDRINLLPGPEYHTVSYFERRYRRRQWVSLEIQASDGTVVMQSLRLRTNSHGQISHPVAAPTWQAIQREQTVTIVVRGADGAEIDSQVVSHGEIAVRLEQRDSATAQLQAMVRDFRSLCESSADYIVVT